MSESTRVRANRKSPTDLASTAGTSARARRATTYGTRVRYTPPGYEGPRRGVRVPATRAYHPREQGAWRAMTWPVLATSFPLVAGFVGAWFFGPWALAVAGLVGWFVVSWLDTKRG
jgi:hypothetical protein